MQREDKRINELEQIDKYPNQDDLLIIFNREAGENGETQSMEFSKLPAGGGAVVTSVNGETGNITGVATDESLQSHIDDKSNPHDVTKEQVGLGNVDNTSDMDKPVSAPVQSELNTKITGEGVKNIIVSEITPDEPENGDIWVNPSYIQPDPPLQLSVYATIWRPGLGLGTKTITGVPFKPRMVDIAVSRGKVDTDRLDGGSGFAYDTGSGIIQGSTAFYGSEAGGFYNHWSETSAFLLGRANSTPQFQATVTSFNNNGLTVNVSAESGVVAFLIKFYR